MKFYPNLIIQIKLTNSNKLSHPYATYKLI